MSEVNMNIVQRKTRPAIRPPAPSPSTSTATAATPIPTAPIALPPVAQDDDSVMLPEIDLADDKSILWTKHPANNEVTAYVNFPRIFSDGGWEKIYDMEEWLEAIANGESLFYVGDNCFNKLHHCYWLGWPTDNEKEFYPIVGTTIEDKHRGKMEVCNNQQGATGGVETANGKPATGVNGSPTNVVIKSRLKAGELCRARDRGNIGEVTCDHGPGRGYAVHFVSPDGQHADVELGDDEVQTLDGDNASLIIIPISARDLVDQNPRLNEVQIDGLARRGETVNIISATKIGKSWLTYSLAMSVVTGRQWLGTFDCVCGKVLLIDNELHKPTISERLRNVARKMDIHDAIWKDGIDVISLRGMSMDLFSLESTIKALKNDRYDLIILDALYRAIPEGIDENSNTQMMRLYNRIDSYAEHLDSTWISIHHSSKGDQSGKSITDVGSGAGSQSRAPDAHLILRPHEEKDVVVLEAAVRSFPPVEPLAIQWDYPTWTRADGIDTRKLRGPANGAEQKQLAKDKEGQDEIVKVLLGGKSLTRRKLIDATGISRDRINRLLPMLLKTNRIEKIDTEAGGCETDKYSLLPEEDF